MPDEVSLDSIPSCRYVEKTTMVLATLPSNNSAELARASHGGTQREWVSIAAYARPTVWEHCAKDVGTSDGND